MKKAYEFLIIGAGPAGIIAIGQLLQRGIKNIVWVDPEFSVGDFGTKWAEVSSNTSVKLFQETYAACDQFQAWLNEQTFTINQFSAEQTCLLKYAAEPLQYITNRLRKNIACEKTIIKALTMNSGLWQANLANGKTIQSQNVILAIGADAKSFSHTNVEEIPVTIALDKNKLTRNIKPHDHVAVFGSSHSAIIMVRDLLELGCKVINFYREPLRFAVKLDDWTLFDNTGLKGNTAIWARENLQGNLPKNLTRVVSTEENIKQYLPLCNKVIYGIGFKPRSIFIDEMPLGINYNPHNGIIAPGLFGLGIAFPEETIDPYGNKELSVGLWKFNNYLQRVLPLWLRYGVRN
jgi:thioredoxin reductase